MDLLIDNYIKYWKLTEVEGDIYSLHAYMYLNKIDAILYFEEKYKIKLNFS